jgi:glucosyl-dolichyl phosphate glucuronosyltransferase
MLEALSRLSPPKRPVRILAVNNGSTDATASILAHWANRLRLVLMDCAEPGKAAAQASAMAHLEGDLIVITDDDIIPEPDWLQCLEQAADETPEASIFGGAITPLPIDPVGPWYEASAGLRADLFAFTLHPRGFVTGADTIFGPNMMLRRSEALRSLKGPFVLGPSSVLRKGKRVFPLGDESEMIARLEREGARSMFVPQARVSHMVRDFQTDLGFMLQRAQNHGRGAAIRALQASHARLARTRMATNSLLRAAWIWPGLLLAGRSRPDARLFARLYGFNWHLGRTKGALFGPFGPAANKGAGPKGLAEDRAAL